jgi:hypothetical protein
MNTFGQFLLVDNWTRPREDRNLLQRCPVDYSVLMEGTADLSRKWNAGQAFAFYQAHQPTGVFVLRYLHNGTRAIIEQGRFCRCSRYKRGKDRDSGIRYTTSHGHDIRPFESENWAKVESTQVFAVPVMDLPAGWWGWCWCGGVAPLPLALRTLLFGCDIGDKATTLVSGSVIFLGNERGGPEVSR